MKLLFVGDVMLGRLVNEVLQTKPPQFPWGDTLPLFEKADIRIGNLECVISDRGQPWRDTPKVFHFRSDAKNIEVLQQAKIDAVSLANNHTLDFGHEAMVEMLESLDRARISHAGAGSDLSAASRTTVINVEGIEVGLIAFTDNEPDWEATADRSGVFYVPTDTNDGRFQHLTQLVQATGQSCDVVIVSAHWGPNWGYRPPPEHPPFAHALIEAGADIIFGHSGHVFRGIEIYQGKPILYCTGDFIDDYAVDEIERNDQSFIFVVEWDEGRLEKIVLYLTVIRDMRALRATGEEAREIASRMRTLCQELGTLANWEPKAGTLVIEKRVQT